MPVASRALERAEWVADDLGVRLTGRSAITSDFRKALATISDASDELVARGFMRAETAAADPIHWTIATPILLSLEVVDYPDFDSPEQRARRAEWHEAIKLFRSALAAHAQIAPLQRANERLLDAFGTIAWRDECHGTSEYRLGSPACMRALMMFRNSLQMLPGSLAATLLLELDQLIDQISDRLFQIQLDRLWRGEMTAEEGAKAVALLKQAAETGQWRDPEGDLDRLVTEPGLRHDRPAAH